VAGKLLSRLPCHGDLACWGDATQRIPVLNFVHSHRGAACFSTLLSAAWREAFSPPLPAQGSESGRPSNLLEKSHRLGSAHQGPKFGKPRELLQGDAASISKQLLDREFSTMIIIGSICNAPKARAKTRTALKRADLALALPHSIHDISRLFSPSIARLLSYINTGIDINRALVFLFNAHRFPA